MAKPGASPRPPIGTDLRPQKPGGAAGDGDRDTDASTNSAQTTVSMISNVHACAAENVSYRAARALRFV